ncbi:hypothetical protein QM012_002074 [Aureobasidium pullulans]|uniref:Uncharacterized protein n=1 Tax=Aureobasidium pullulans TaxID=5580 RepID=A0ABR0TES0_AURPU
MPMEAVRSKSPVYRGTVESVSRQSESAKRYLVTDAATGWLVQVLIYYLQPQDGIVDRIADSLIGDRLERDVIYDLLFEAVISDAVDLYYTIILILMLELAYSLDTTGATDEWQKEQCICCVPVSQFIPATTIGPLTKPQKS